MEKDCNRGKSIAVTGKSRLLSENDPQPVSVFNDIGQSRIVLTCEHAGNTIPECLGTLGLDSQDLLRHIAWDIGAAVTAKYIAEHIDAPLVLQNYSRLVIDCNRPEYSSDMIPVVSDGTQVAGNAHLTVTDCKIRFAEISQPFHRTVQSLLDERIERGETPLVFAIHSYTPRLQSDQIDRPWDLGLLYNRDNRLAVLFREVLDNTEHDLVVADNKPYAVSDESDYTLPVHCEKRGIHGLLLEIRNDLIADKTGVSTCAELLGDVLLKIDKLLP